MRVRQGENLSPILFAMYLDDLESTLSGNCKGLLLLYADDTVLMAESADDLQTALDNMAEYCKYWQLQVNTAKTKIVIFSRGKIQKKPPYLPITKSLLIYLINTPTWDFVLTIMANSR